MKTYELTFFNLMEGCKDRITLKAYDSRIDLGARITDYCDDLYHADTQTDGIDVWSTDEDGNTIYYWRSINLIEINQPEWILIYDCLTTKGVIFEHRLWLTDKKAAIERATSIFLKMAPEDMKKWDSIVIVFAEWDDELECHDPDTVSEEIDIKKICEKVVSYYEKIENEK